MYLSWEHLERESSPVDWCEDNYTFSPYIAEFVNTVSNIIFIVMPPLLMRLHGQYSLKAGRGIHLIWTLLIVVGTCSAYFHATLSLLGQLLDEMAILWVVMAGFALWYPRDALPGRWKEDPQGRRKFANLCIVLATITTFLGFIQPILNAFILLILGVPALVLLALQLKIEKDQRVINLGRRTIVFYLLAIFCWLNDRLLCEFWYDLGFPYLHGAWHVLIFLASYTAIVLFAYFEVKNHISGEVPELRYYPVDTWQYGIPFVTVQDKGL